MRVTKSADALRAGGALAVVSTHHVAGGDEQFFVDAQRCYERWDPSTPAGLRLPAAADVPVGSEELDASGRFGPAVVRRYEREIAYTAPEYMNELLIVRRG